MDVHCKYLGWALVSEISKFILFFYCVNLFKSSQNSYRTIVTVGYGDISPKNNIEKTLALFMLIFGCGK